VTCLKPPISIKLQINTESQEFLAAAKAFLQYQPLTKTAQLRNESTDYQRGRTAVVGLNEATGSQNHYLPFLFVKDYKTASEAVYETLFRFIKGVCVDGKLTNLNGYCATGKLGHGSVEVVRKQLRQMLDVDFDSVFSFSVVRNPWDRQVSWFFWVRSSQFVTKVPVSSSSWLVSSADMRSRI